MTKVTPFETYKSRYNSVDRLTNQHHYFSCVKLKAFRLIRSSSERVTLTLGAGEIELHLILMYYDFIFLNEKFCACNVIQYLQVKLIMSILFVTGMQCCILKVKLQSTSLCLPKLPATLLCEHKNRRWSHNTPSYWTEKCLPTGMLTS